MKSKNQQQEWVFLGVEGWGNGEMLGKKYELSISSDRSNIQHRDYI